MLRVHLWLSMTPSLMEAPFFHTLMLFSGLFCGRVLLAVLGWAFVWGGQVYDKADFHKVPNSKPLILTENYFSLQILESVLLYDRVPWMP